MFSIIRTGLDAANRDLAVSFLIILLMQEQMVLKKVKLNSKIFIILNIIIVLTIARGMGVKTIKPRQSFAQGSLQANKWKFRSCNYG